MFCKSGAHIDCNKVTASRYSKLFELFSWAELGLAYFAAVILWLSISPLSNVWLSPLLWLSIFTLPFTVWSLFTQAFLIRKWCLFCCAIVALLWINLSILYILFPFDPNFQVPEFALFALLLLFCIAMVTYISKTANFGDKYFKQRETARIKYDFKTIQSQLESLYETDNVGFVWDESRSSINIALYLSIACSHCGAAIKELRRLSEIYPDFGYRLIFAVNSYDFEHKSNIITNHFISLYKTMKKDDFFNMLDNWYSTLNKNLDALQKAYPASTYHENKAKMEALYQFGQQSKIGYSPAILLNGRLISQFYSYRDLLGIVQTLNA